MQRDKFSGHQGGPAPDNPNEDIHTNSEESAGDRVGGFFNKVFQECVSSIQFPSKLAKNLPP